MFNLNNEIMKPTKRDTQVFKALSENSTKDLALIETDVNGVRTFCIVLIKEDNELVPLAIITNQELMEKVTMIDDVKLLKLNKEATLTNLFGEYGIDNQKQN